MPGGNISNSDIFHVWKVRLTLTWENHILQDVWVSTQTKSLILSVIIVKCFLLVSRILNEKNNNNVVS